MSDKKKAKWVIPVVIVAAAAVLAVLTFTVLIPLIKGPCVGTWELTSYTVDGKQVTLDKNFISRYLLDLDGTYIHYFNIDVGLRGRAKGRTTSETGKWSKAENGFVIGSGKTALDFRFDEKKETATARQSNGAVVVYTKTE